MSSLARRLNRLGLSLVGAVALITVAAPALAVTAVDAVPGDVVRYIADGLLADLDEFYGPGVDDSGTDFDDAVGGAATRIYAFTEGFVTGDTEVPPVRRLNEWTSVVTVDKVPLGVAIVTIDPVTVSAQLASFTPSEGFGTVIAALPETARLVRDDARSAWFSLDGETPETLALTPVVSGTSGIDEPVELADYQELVANWPTAAPAEGEAEARPSDGLILVGLAVLLIVLLIAVEALLPTWRRKAKERADATPADEETDAS